MFGYYKFVALIDVERDDNDGMNIGELRKVKKI
jgi:hypothetical protein